jgi:chemotaxis protein MotB
VSARKKKKDEGGGGVPAWMATFSDLVTLLLTFFVMLMAMASFDEAADLETALESLRDALASLGFGDGLVSMIAGENLSDQIRKDVTARPLEPTEHPSGEADHSDAVVKLSQTPTEVRLTLDDQVFFTAGGKTLRPGARDRLRGLGVVLAAQEVTVRVEGHTDASGDEASNWELSVLRSLVVADTLHQEGNVPLERLQARGYGAFHPTVERDEDQPRNRRIDIVLVGDASATQQAHAAVKRWRGDRG